jgi:hypothetical protein
LWIAREAIVPREPRELARGFAFAEISHHGCGSAV